MTDEGEIEDNVLGMRQVAKYFGCLRRDLRRMIDEGEFDEYDTFTIRGEWFIWEAEFLRYLAEREPKRSQGLGLKERKRTSMVEA